MLKNPTEYQVNVSLALLALFFDQLDELDIPAGEENEDPLIENFRYIKAHFNSPVKLIKTVSNYTNLVHDKAIDQNNIEAVEELIQSLPQSGSETSGADETLQIHDYIVAFMNYYYAYHKVEMPNRKGRSDSNISKGLLESLSKKSKSKLSKHDINHEKQDHKDDPIDTIDLPQDSKNKHQRTKSHMKDPPETIPEVDAEQKLARVRSTSRERNQESENGDNLVPVQPSPRGQKKPTQEPDVNVSIPIPKNSRISEVKDVIDEEAREESHLEQSADVGGF